ncbi:hypothetical protein [Bacillus paralicheniformis]|uniref:hypothetical protein n=1 Tax=Bacillus TaxID=1386 RepID=UPI00135DF714|nr:hypothetical protein [Bacillus paralicheniformis]TWM60719.1 hypothetical protein CHCC14814_1654 [Bacillus paralicheniformis]
MNKESLLQAFYQEIHGADETAFQKAACSFMNLWDYEYGCLDGLPDQADRLIGQIVDRTRRFAFGRLKERAAIKAALFIFLKKPA